MFGGMFGGGPQQQSQGVDWTQILQALGATLQDVGAAEYGRPGGNVAAFEAGRKKLADNKKYQDTLKASFGTPEFAPVQSTPQITAPGQLAERQAAGVYNQPSMMFSGPTGQALGYDQAAAMLPMLQGLDPSQGLPVLLNAMSQAQDRGDRDKERNVTRAQQLTDQGVARSQQFADNARVPLTPEEVKAAGYRPGTVAYRDGLGRVTVAQDSDVMSPEAMSQRQKIAGFGREPAPSTVVVGNQLVDRRTGKPIYTAPPTVKPMPASLQKAESDDVRAIQTSKSISQDIKGVAKLMDDGKLVLSPFANYAGAAMNASGMSNENSRNIASFKSTLEKLRNDSLRLNAGVQTDGDAQRAWKELFDNINDQALVRQRLNEIDAINQRGADLRAQQIDLRRQNYGIPSFDESQINPQGVIGNQPQPPPQATRSVGGKTYVQINGEWYEQ